MSRSRDPVKDACVASLARIADQLIDLMANTGVSVQEFCRLVRIRSVHTIASRLMAMEGRVSKSHIAILTGLSRGEVARILKRKDKASGEMFNTHPARKVLARWHESPRFVSTSGDPAILPVFGRRKSFERLVSVSTGGLPVRAMLDALVQLKAVEILPGQLVRATSRIPTHSELTSQSLSALGERTSNLLSTLRGNMTTTADRLFEGTAFVTEVSSDLLPLLRRELEQQGTSFIGGATSLLSKSNAKRKAPRQRRQKRFRLGVTTFCFQEELMESESRPKPKAAPRKNLRRARSSQTRSALAAPLDSSRDR